MYTRPIQGKHTKASGEYCHGLACAILEGLQAEARLRNPQRFLATQHEVYYTAPANLEEDWNPVLDEVEQRFSNTYKKPYVLSEDDILYQQIQELVPWTMKRIQVLWTPSARRWPQDIPFTHRGCAYRDINGKFAIEHEDMVSVPYPKQRFSHPVCVAVFFFGNAPEDSPDQPQFQDDREITATTRVAGLNTDIHFEGGPPMTREMRSSIARLHCNLGHPPKAEVVRILAAAGKLDSKILAGLDALRCGTCMRLSKPIKPPTSSTATATRYAGAFGEHLQSDIVFIRMLSGRAVPVLGMVCMSTNYHAAKALNSRSPDHVLSVMQEIWYRPLGLPISITVDADTAYLASNQEWHQNLGIEFDIIPTEEAWKLGKIGRRNALMRTLAERLIDQNGVIHLDQLNSVLVAVLRSMNNSTYSHGRSPCQAVFGRMPRPVGDLLSDNKALAISPMPPGEQHALRPELLRAEAITALAQFSASQAVRRALLRKTRNQNDPSGLEPGQAIAFWRQSAKARQHKRGAWCLGRFLALDPDRKSMWIQGGRNSIRVGSTQVREAAGWESWTPTIEDMQLIKQAEDNITRGLWSDEIQDPPDDDAMADIEADIFDFPIRPTMPTQPTAPAEQQAFEVDDEEMLPVTTTSLPHNMATMPQNIQPGMRVQDALTPQQPANTHIEQQQHNLQQSNVHQESHQHAEQHIYHQQTININSPTYQSFAPQPDFGMNPPTPRRSRARSRTPSRTGLQPEQRPALEQSTDTAPTPPPAIEAPPTPALLDQPTEHTHNNAAGVMMSNLEELDTGEIQQRPVGWDGSPEYPSPFRQSKQAYKAYLVSKQRRIEMTNAGIKEDPTRADCSSSDEDLTISNERHLSNAKRSNSSTESSPGVKSGRCLR